MENIEVLKKYAESVKLETSDFEKEESQNIQEANTCKFNASVSLLYIIERIESKDLDIEEVKNLVNGLREVAKYSDNLLKSVIENKDLKRIYLDAITLDYMGIGLLEDYAKELGFDIKIKYPEEKHEPKHKKLDIDVLKSIYDEAEDDIIYYEQEILNESNLTITNGYNYLCESLDILLGIIDTYLKGNFPQSKKDIIDGFYNPLLSNKEELSNYEVILEEIERENERVSINRQTDVDKVRFIYEKLIESNNISLEIIESIIKEKEDSAQKQNQPNK